MARRMGGGPGAVDKAKDFKGTLKKLLKINFLIKNISKT